MTGRFASEAERVMQTRSNASPPSSDHTRAIQEELTVSIKGLSKELLDLKAWINDVLVDMLRSAAIDKESIDGGMKEAREDMRNLRKDLREVDSTRHFSED